MSAKTLYDKLWDSHVVRQNEDGTSLLYIDRQLIHEVTSPQAFEGLRMAQRQPWRLSANLATPDHNVPTTDREQGIADPVSKLQVDTLDSNCDYFGIEEFKMDDIKEISERRVYRWLPACALAVPSFLFPRSPRRRFRLTLI